MRTGFLLVLLSLPLIELALLIKVGQWIGFWPTMALIIGTGMAGGLLLQQQGLSAANKMMEAVREGRPPIQAAVDSGFTVLAAMLLISPGVLCDIAGLALLVPPIRTTVARWMLGRMDYVEVHVSRGSETDEMRQGRRPDLDDGGVIIEGEFKRVDDPAGRRPGEGGSAKPPRER